jgi:hypothetical protein
MLNNRGWDISSVFSDSSSFLDRGVQLVIQQQCSRLRCNVQVKYVKLVDTINTRLELDLFHNKCD